MPGLSSFQRLQELREKWAGETPPTDPKERVQFEAERLAQYNALLVEIAASGPLGRAFVEGEASRIAHEIDPRSDLEPAKREVHRLLSVAELEDLLQSIDEHMVEDGAAEAGETETPRLTRRERRAKWMAEAMLLVQDHPDWTDKRIAREVGTNPSQLSRSDVYQRAAEQVRGKKTDTATRDTSRWTPTLSSGT